jgi:hypothetical protein
LLLSSSKPSLGVFQLAGYLLHIHTSTWPQKFLSPLPCIKEEAFTPSSPRHQQVFWRRCWEGRRLLQGEFHTHILYFVLSFALLYFYLYYFIKNPKKLESFIVVLTCLLLVC